MALIRVSSLTLPLALALSQNGRLQRGCSVTGILVNVKVDIASEMGVGVLC